MRYQKIRASIAYFFLGDISTGITAELKSIVDPLGVGIIRLGPPLIGFHIVCVQPRRFSPEEIKAHAEYLFDLPGKDARLLFDICSLTNSSFFLAMNNSMGVQLKNKALQYLKTGPFLSELPNMMADLFNELPHYQDDKNKLIERHIINLFTRTLFNFELNEELFNVLAQLKKNRREYIIWPRWMWKFVSAYRKVQSEFDCAAKSFLREQFRLMRTQESHKLSTMLSGIALSKLDKNKKLNEMTDQDIEKLIVDPEVRLTITGVIGIDNLTKVVEAGLPRLYYPENSAILKNISEEVALQLEKDKEIHQISWTNKDAMPMLHAYFLETLRFNAPLPIFRFTSSAISMAKLSIPARSIIIYDLPTAIRNSVGEDCYLFRPQRFLDEAGQLNNLAKLQQGMLIPFGTGARSCPAVKLSEIIFKRCIGEFALRVKCFSSSFFELHPEMKANNSSSMVASGASLFAQSKKRSEIEKNSLMKETKQEVSKGVSFKVCK